MSANLNHDVARGGRLKALARYRDLLAPRTPATTPVDYQEIHRLCRALGRNPERLSADAAIFRNHQGLEAMARNLREAERAAAEAQHSLEKKERSIRETNERLAAEVKELRERAWKADVRADNLELANYVAGKSRGLDTTAARAARRDATHARGLADKKEVEAKEARERLKSEFEAVRARSAETNERLERTRQAGSMADAIRRANPELFEDYPIAG
jgi:hypothetical protein